MRIYHPNILPFNIAVIRVSEIPTMTDWVDAEGQPLNSDSSSTHAGVVIKGYRKDEQFGNISYSIIAFPKRPDISTIAHEAFHSTCDLLENIGINYRAFDGNEIYAYVLGYITGCVTDAINTDDIWKD